jgi:hypothetical protein
MVTQETRFIAESEFAAKCRLALEKNLGIKIPQPKCLKQVANFSAQTILEEQ